MQVRRECSASEGGVWCGERKKGSVVRYIVVQSFVLCIVQRDAVV